MRAVAKAIDDFPRDLPIGVRQGNDELVAAEATDEVVSAHAGANDAADLFQDEVAGHVEGATVHVAGGVGAEPHHER